MKIKTILKMALPAFMLTQSALASPFTSCPSQAFLIQGPNAQFYGIDLSSGDFKLLHTFNNGSMNGFAYNFFDDYIYSGSTSYKDLVKIDSNYNVEKLNISGIVSSSIYVGDVSPNVNKYYYYHSLHGIHSVSLDSNDPTYKQDVLLTDIAAVGNLKIHDWAINPSANDNFAYSVGRYGELLKIDLQPTSTTVNPATTLANFDITGPFGAVYFDSNDNLYISNNTTGKIYRIKVTDENPQVVLFANGPSSAGNDGGRCAFAPIVNSTAVATMDFGDAPDSYGTSFENNGARHLVNQSGLYLGQSVDAESVAYPDPLSDDKRGDINDEDGITFLNNANIGQTGLLQALSSGSGYLNAWADWNKNGIFDADEKIIDAQSVNKGQNIFTYTVPASTTIGETWMRFRLSADADVAPTGGVSSGEVEDYKISIYSGTATSFYPGENAWTTIAFEDEWPLQGDYDLNDMAFKYRTAVSEKDGKVTQVTLTGQLHANGGDYHNGFAIRLRNVPRSSVDEENILYTINGLKKSVSPLETGTNDAVFIATNDIRNYTGVIEGCTYFRTEEGCDMPPDGVFEFTINVPFKAGHEVLSSAFPASPYDPFIFATPGTWRQAIFKGSPPGRGLEIHLKNQSPTIKFNTSLYNLEADRSNPSLGHYFQNENGLPWAMEVPSDWEHPKENVDLLKAYPKFKSFVESNGSQESSWFLPSKANTQHTFPKWEY